MRRYVVTHFDAGGRLQKAKRTSIGGAYIPARISRTGVLTYRLPDGHSRRELRHPDEVFDAASLATLDAVPVIDIEHHNALLSPEDYRRATVGHVKSFSRDGTFVASELVVQDGDTLEAIDAGERTEVSCGYSCKLDMTAGVFEGEAYDCIQREIRYNHVALCPPNRGRAGPDVALRLDAGHDDEVVCEPRLLHTLNTNPRPDASDLRTELAIATRDARANMAWRADSAPPPRLAGTVGKASSDRTVAIVASTPGRKDDGLTIRAFDLERYNRNPVVLWAHDNRGLPIGTAEDVVQAPDGSLRMKVRLATAEANPTAELIWNGIQQGIIRAVSIGFRLGEGGVAELLEVSLVPVGMDENAGTEALNPAAAEPRSRYFEEPSDEEKDEHTDADDFDAARRRRDETLANLWKTTTAKPAESSAPPTMARRADVDDDDVDAARKARDERLANMWRTGGAA